MRIAINRLSITLLPVLLLASTAEAQRKDPLAGQPAVRARAELRKGRFELVPQLIVSVNQDFRHHIGGGLAAQYHINDWLGVALSGSFGGGVDTALTGQVKDVLPATQAGLQPSKDQFGKHIASITGLLGVYGVLTPIAGKLAFFESWYLKYDLYGLLGFGGMLLKNDFSNRDTDSINQNCLLGDLNQCDPKNAGFKAAGLLGIGVHVYFNDWIALNLELRDYIASTNFRGFDTNGDRIIDSSDNSISNSLFAGIGLTFMLPPKAKLSH